MNRITFKIFVIILLAFFCLTACWAQNKQHGKASYYSKRATGARTASGQRLHHDSLTCAHRYYPFGTHLKVTNLRNNKSVIVKVIDRGPFGRGRIIDLSWAAAKEIGMIAQGVASVKVEIVEKPVPFRPEEEKLPQIDFEVAESDYTLEPHWNSKSAKGKAHQGKDLKKVVHSTKAKETYAKKDEEKMLNRKESWNDTESKISKATAAQEHKIHRNK